MQHATLQNGALQNTRLVLQSALQWEYGCMLQAMWRTHSKTSTAQATAGAVKVFFVFAISAPRQAISCRCCPCWQTQCGDEENWSTHPVFAKAPSRLEGHSICQCLTKTCDRPVRNIIKLKPKTSLRQYQPELLLHLLTEPKPLTCTHCRRAVPWKQE